MRARFEVALRLAVACLALVAVACGGGGGGSGKKDPGSSEIAFTKGALASVPLVKPPAPGAAARLVGNPVVTSIDMAQFMAQLFKMECRRPPSEGVDYCPAGTPPASDYGTGLGQDPYGFDMQALVGFIYHAQMYTELVTSCSGEGLTSKTVTGASYAAASSDPGADPTKFIFDEYGTYTCRSSRVSDAVHETRMVSAVADGSYQTTLHTRYEYVAGGDPQTDFFQADVTMEAGTATFLALNFASAKPLSSRLVLLVNLADHKFAMKYYTPKQPATGGPSGYAPLRYAVAAGVAGYDLTTGLPNAGSYYVHFSDDPGVFEACVNNADGTFAGDFSACDVDPMNHTAWTSSAVQTFLGVPADTAARIGDYLAVFGNNTDLSEADGWSDAMAQDTQRDLYWPATLN
jgi:hypothetical protein